MAAGPSWRSAVPFLPQTRRTTHNSTTYERPTRDYARWRQYLDEFHPSHADRSHRESSERPNAMAAASTTDGGHVSGSQPLTANQRAARKVTDNLPMFAGDITQWPMFISNFENSTEICGFTDVENTFRLQKDTSENVSTNLITGDQEHALTHSNTHMIADDTLFRYVPVVVYGRDGQSVITYAFYDDGASASFVDSSLIDELGLKGEPHPLCLQWTGETKKEEKDSVKLKLLISGVQSSAKVYELPKVHTVRNLSLREQSLRVEELAKKFPHLRDLPVTSYINVTPRILIGIDNCHLGTALKYREGRIGEPMAEKSRLGWTIFGPTCPKASTTSQSLFHICICNEKDDLKLDTALKEYFAIDSLGITNPGKCMSKEEEKTLAMLSDGTQHLNGQYETTLLWKQEGVRLPPSNDMALKRHACLIRRRKRDNTLAEAMKEKMKHYEKMGYIRRVSSEELQEKGPRDWYLPIFPVTNANKPGKVRVVFDAAAQSCGVSLNDYLLTGPEELTNLVAVLHKFRAHPVAVVGDIREMFFQVKMNKRDQRSQMFYWIPKDELTDKPIVFAVTVMTFGATCSPGTAQFVKKALDRMHIPRTPSDEILLTTLKECENIVNSRPLTYVPIDDYDASPITPNHILLGSSDGGKITTAFDDSGAAVRSTWVATKRNADQFWNNFEI